MELSVDQTRMIVVSIEMERRRRLIFHKVETGGESFEMWSGSLTITLSQIRCLTWQRKNFNNRSIIDGAVIKNT